MIPFEEALEATLEKLGLGEPAAMLEISRDWASIAGGPWADQTRPLYLQGQVLVVETADRAQLAFLRYAVSDLETRLVERFGPETVHRVELRPPRRRSGEGR